jgi:uncharacterized protein
MHDAYRVDKGGKPTFGRVLRGLEVLTRHQVDWNVLTPCTRSTAATLPVADAVWGGGVKGWPRCYGEPGGMCVHAETCGSQLASFVPDLGLPWPGCC